jgi:serine/threonine-protein kinase
VLDFGIAKAVGRAQTTREGQIKGKLAYMPPEQINGADIDRRVDVYAAGVVLWEALTAQRLFDGENEGTVLQKIMRNDVPKPSLVVPNLSPTVDAIVLKAVAKDPARRFATAWEMAVALEEALGVETPRKVGEIVDGIARDAIARRSARLKQLESQPADLSRMLTASSVLAAPHPNAPTPVGPNAEEPTLRRKSSRPLLVALAIMAGLGATTALALLAVVGTREDPAEVTPARSTSAAATAPGPARASAPVLPPVAPPSAPDSVADPSPSASQAPTATSPPTQRPTSPPRPPATTSPPAPRADCNPPYVIVEGIRKIKPECI